MLSVSERRTAMIDHEVHTAAVADIILSTRSISISTLHPASLHRAPWADEPKAPTAHHPGKVAMVRCSCHLKGVAEAAATTAKTSIACLCPMDQHAFLRFKLSLGPTSIPSRR